MKTIIIAPSGLDCFPYMAYVAEKGEKFCAKTMPFSTGNTENEALGGLVGHECERLGIKTIGEVNPCFNNSMLGGIVRAHAEYFGLEIIVEERCNEY